eukprot:4614965-Amphidinium_carterae.1
MVRPRDVEENEGVPCFERGRWCKSQCGPMEADCDLLPQHSVAPIYRYQPQECQGAHYDIEVRGLLAAGGVATEFGHHDAAFQSGGNSTFRFFLERSEALRIDSRFSSVVGATKRAQGSCSFRESGHASENIGSGQRKQLQDGECWQDFGLGVWPGWGGRNHPEAKWEWKLSPQAAAEGVGGEDGAPALASRRNTDEAGDGKEQRECDELGRSFSEPRASAAVHGSCEASSSKAEIETEGKEERDRREQNMAETVSWIKMLWKGLKPAWLTHHVGATRDLLPLPILDVSESGISQRLSAWRGTRGEEWDACTVHLADAWLEVVVCVLNSQIRSEASWWHPKAAQRVALSKLWEQCFDFALLDVTVPSDGELQTYLKASRVDYQGEIAVMAEELTWTRVKAALPPAESCATLSVEDVCEGSALKYVECPESALLPHYETLPAPKPARVRLRRSERLVFGRELLKRGLVSVVRESELVRWHGVPVLNGLFGIPKPSQLVLDDDGVQKPALRLIMNLQPINGFMKSFPGDTHTLPVMTRLRSLIVDGDSIIESSFEDLKGCFYLLRLRSSWARLFAFDLKYTPAELDLPDTGETGPVYLGARVVPMGWKSAVGLVQYIHKRLLRESALPLQMGASLPSHRELRADRPLPIHRGSCQGLDKLWQVYIDDFDVLELVSINEEAKRGPPDWQQRARATYDHYNLPTSRAKAGERERRSVRLGYELDGEIARLGVPPTKIGRLIGLTRFALEAPISKKSLQVILGHWIHVLMLRRECMSFLDEVWRVLQRLGMQGRPLPLKVRLEFVQCLAVLPLVSVYLRSTLDTQLTASDASEFGGGVCVTRGLSPQGFEAWSGNEVLRAQVGRDEVGLLTIGDNVGIVPMAATAEGSECAFHLALVTQPGGEQLLGAQFVMCEAVSTWECLSSKLDEAVNRCPHAHRVLVVCMAIGKSDKLEGQ